MRKLLLSVVLGLTTVTSFAQNYTNKFTHLSGTQVYNTASPVIPISVTVTPVNGTPGWTPTSCGAGPYYLAYDAAHKGGYRFDFSPHVTHVKFEINELHDDDTVFIRVNNPVPGVGPITPITYAMLSAFNNGCTNPTAPTNFTYLDKKGRLSAPYPAPPFSGTGPNHTGNNTTTLVYASSPGYINSIEIVHMRDSATSGGIVFNAYAAFDTCQQPLVVKVDSPICTNRPIYFHASDWSSTGATYTWTNGGANGIPVADLNNPNPVIPSATISAPSSNGTYSVAVQRGICTYNGSVNVDVDLTPQVNKFTQQGPKCAGDNDTLTLVSGANTTIWFFPADGSAPQKANTPPFYNNTVINNIQVADAGTWGGVAISIKGCVSDTAHLDVLLNSLVKADFDFDTKQGCSSDTVQFIDNSLGNNKWTWDFADGSPILSGTNPTTDGNPKHIYGSQNTYKVKLIAENSVCKDSITKSVVLNHPLVADFEMYNSIDLTTQDDSICQGDTIVFKNKSVSSIVEPPKYIWDFKDGTGTTNVFEPTHRYIKYGVYDVTLTITDYLGCSRTKTKTLVVDSIGSASFFSDTVLCTGQTIKFAGDYSTIGGTYALWNFGDGHTIQDQFSIQHAFDKPGTYLVQLEAHYRICRDTTYKQNVYVNAYPTVDLGPDTAMCVNGGAVALQDLINPAGTPGLRWRWNTETMDTTQSVVVHHPGTYSVTVDNQGCTTADTVVVKKNCYIDIPNVFTPNGDGYNDYFLPRQLLSRNVSKFSMTIYNRWGETVFETSSIDGRGWDGKFNGKDQPEGVYVYLIKVSFGNDTNENYQGNITLLR